MGVLSFTFSRVTDTPPCTLHFRARAGISSAPLIFEHEGVAPHRSVFYLWRPTQVDPKDDIVLELAVDAGAPSPPVSTCKRSETSHEHDQRPAPESLHEGIREAARREGISINQFIASAAGEKLAAWATEGDLAARAGRGDRGKFEAALGRVPDRAPEPEDAL